MKYVLMHKEIPVAAIELDEVLCGIRKIEELYNPEHLPVGIHTVNGNVNREELNSWWRKRSIPSSRDGLRSALYELNIHSPEALLDKCYGLSLSDQYWICPDNSGLVWSKVNFFDNSFSEDVGNILLGHASSSESVSLIAPDNTSDGWLKKKWSIIDGKRCLLKAGSSVFHQEPYNEMIASAIMERLGINHTNYTVTVYKEEPYSVCENFVTKDTELITAHHLMNSRKKPNHITVYQHFVNCCQKVGLDAIPFLDRMLTVDFLIVNEDRHTNNFGLIRNANTLEYIDFAPIYDNGTALWFNALNQRILPLSPSLKSKPFKPTHYEQIKLVSSFDWLDLEALKGIDEEFSEILKGSEYIDDERRSKLCGALKDRVALLSDIVNKHSISETQFALNDIANDLTEDVAYSGEQGNDEDLER